MEMHQLFLVSIVLSNACFFCNIIWYGSLPTTITHKCWADLSLKLHSSSVAKFQEISVLTSIKRGNRNYFKRRRVCESRDNVKNEHYDTCLD